MEVLGGRSRAPMEVLQGKVEKSRVPMELLQGKRKWSGAPGGGVGNLGGGPERSGGPKE